MQLEKSKIGQYFMFIGLILLVIFFVSSQGHSPAFEYLVGGLGLTILGGYIFFQDRNPVEPNTTRFRSLRKLRERRAKRREESEQRQKK